MPIQFSFICDPRLIDAVEHVAGALEKIASAIEHHTDKAFPSLPEKALNLARWSELQKMIDIQIEENERRDQFAQETRAVIEAETQKRAEKIIKAKDLRCRNCTRYQKTSAIKDRATIFWCPLQNKAVFGNDIACVNIDPRQDVIDKIEADGGIKFDTDGEVIP